MNEPYGLFVGLSTLDVIFGVVHVPGPNEKMVASKEVVAAGGPATNASVACRFLGTRGRLVTAIGKHPLAAGIYSDLESQGVQISDMSASELRPPAFSAIMVGETTGQRAVVSRNAEGRDVKSTALVRMLASRAGAALVDGHHPGLALDAVRSARESGVLTVLDGGSWKPNTGQLLQFIDVAICSDDFRPPGIEKNDVLDYLLEAGIRHVAITRGESPILWASKGHRGEISVPPIPVVDTLGAGDVLHGAFVHAAVKKGRVSNASDFCRALRFSASVASLSCASFGTRDWMSEQSAAICRDAVL